MFVNLVNSPNYRNLQLKKSELERLIAERETKIEYFVKGIYEMEADIHSLEKGTGDNISLLEEQISAIEKRNEENEETTTNTLNNDKITKLERRIYFF